MRLRDRLGGGQRVAGRRQLHADAGGRLAVQARRGRVGLAAELDARHVASGARSSRRCWRAARCCRTARPMLSWPLTTTVAAMPWPGDVGQVADGAGRDLRVLRADRGVDVGRRQVEADAAWPGRSRCAWRARCRTAAPGRRRACAGFRAARCARRSRPARSGRMAGLSDDRMVNSRKLERDLSTRTPCCVTAAGRRGVARARRFCTSTCARSALVPGSKVSVIGAGAVGLRHRLHVDQAGRAVHLALDDADARCLPASAPRRPGRRR